MASGTVVCVTCKQPEYMTVDFEYQGIQVGHRHAPRLYHKT